VVAEPAASPLHADSGSVSVRHACSALDSWAVRGGDDATAVVMTAVCLQSASNSKQTSEPARAAHTVPNPDRATVTTASLAACACESLPRRLPLPSLLCLCPSSSATAMARLLCSASACQPDSSAAAAAAAEAGRRTDDAGARTTHESQHITYTQRTEDERRMYPRLGPSGQRGSAAPLRPGARGGVPTAH
jgi:hypothetical protein